MTEMKSKNVREVALNLILRIDQSGGFSHLMIHHAIENEAVSRKDTALLTEIVYGSLERKLTLQYDLSRFIKQKKRIEPWVESLLLLSIYQMRYLNQVPTYAIINEAVIIAKKRGHKGIASFVNGVLRQADRKGKVDFSKIENKIERLAIETSHPQWLVERWVDQYGYERTYEMCMTNVDKKPLYLRVNRLKAQPKEVISLLAEEGVEAVLSSQANYGIMVRNGNVLQTSDIEAGLATIQDLSSLLASDFTEVKSGMTVLDSCSAPGGKATAMAEAMDNTGDIYAYDLHKNKTKLIKQNAKRLGLTNLHVSQADARHLQDKHDAESFDRILVDAPCSGLGIIRSKPDIKYSKTEADINNLSHIQFDILNGLAPLVKKGGKLIYSTCTVDRLENNDVIKRFLQENPQFVLDPSFTNEVKEKAWTDVLLTDEGLQIFPQSFNSDGFFVTRLMKLDEKNGE